MGDSITSLSNVLVCLMAEDLQDWTNSDTCLLALPGTDSNKTKLLEDRRKYAVVAQNNERRAS
ncbi:hypothetical protein J6590_078061 [Homalodisca vitripennis]|nr:hypothetical protein J6590_078061 [Homalodisca vitripennis]